MRKLIFTVLLAFIIIAFTSISSAKTPANTAPSGNLSTALSAPSKRTALRDSMLYYNFGLSPMPGLDCAQNLESLQLQFYPNHMGFFDLEFGKERAYCQNLSSCHGGGLSSVNFEGVIHASTSRSILQAKQEFENYLKSVTQVQLQSTKLSYLFHRVKSVTVQVALKLWFKAPPAGYPTPTSDLSWTHDAHLSTLEDYTDTMTPFREALMDGKKFEKFVDKFFGAGVLALYQSNATNINLITVQLSEAYFTEGFSTPGMYPASVHKTRSCRGGSSCF